MFSIKNFTKYVVVISVLLLLGSPIYTKAQKAQGQGDGKSNTGRGVVVGMDGAAYKTNPNGQCPLVIPDWLFERIKKSPQKYSLKITVRKIPQSFLETKQNSGADQKFACNISHGSKSMKGDFTRSTFMSQKKFLTTFALTNTTTPNVEVGCFLAGEPVPGAEIYVELEPDDEP